MAELIPSGLAMLAEVAGHQVYRDLIGHSWYRTWSNRVTTQVAELETARLLRIDPWSKQWELTDAGRAALDAHRGQ